MMIDKIGGTSPTYGPKKTNAAAKSAPPGRAADNVSISSEAARAADASRVATMAKNSSDTSRAEKLKEVKQKLADGAYDNPSDEVLSEIAGVLTGSIQGR